MVTFPVKQQEGRDAHYLQGRTSRLVPCVPRYQSDHTTMCCSFEPSCRHYVEEYRLIVDAIVFNTHLSPRRLRIFATRAMRAFISGSEAWITVPLSALLIQWCEMGRSAIEPFVQRTSHRWACLLQSATQTLRLVDDHDNQLIESRESEVLEFDNQHNSSNSMETLRGELFWVIIWKR